MVFRSVTREDSGVGKVLKKLTCGNDGTGLRGVGRACDGRWEMKDFEAGRVGSKWD